MLTDYFEHSTCNVKKPGKVGKMTLYREERYSGLVSRAVLKTSLGWKQFGLSLTIIVERHT